MRSLFVLAILCAAAVVSAELSRDGLLEKMQSPSAQDALHRREENPTRLMQQFGYQFPADLLSVGETETTTKFAKPHSRFLIRASLAKRSATSRKVYTPSVDDGEFGQNMYYVNFIQGNDGTAVKNNRNLPWKTLQGAINSASYISDLASTFVIDDGLSHLADYK